MDQDRPWSRGRSGWGSEGLGHREGADGRSQSPRRMYHSVSSQAHHKFMANRPVWDDAVHDLASMRLTPADLARKLASRQSSNLVLARAQLLEQSRRPGSYNPNLPPALAARLQAARQQNVDSILAQSNAMLMASQKIRQSEHCEREQDAIRRHQDPDGQEDTSVTESVRQEGASGRTTPQPKDVLESSNDLGKFKTLKTVPSMTHQKKAEGERPVTGLSKEINEPPHTPKHHSGTQKPTRRLSADGAATRTSLDHTITMVVNTCRELWQQLQEERVTRERLQQQLHQQGNVITTLTSELLQIQDQQEAILREVSDARASGLWGGDGDLSGGSSSSTDRGEDLMASQAMGSHTSGGRPSPQSVSSRHPQRSILRATRTIHQAHLRQPPPYQSHHQSHTFTSLPYQPPHSPRPHQPSPGSRDLSPPLGGLPVMRSEANSNNAYRNSIAKQIRDALASGQASAYVTDINKIPSQLNPDSLQQEASQEMKSLDKERVMDDKQSASSVNKENVLSHVNENVMDSTVTELLEKKK